MFLKRPSPHPQTNRIPDVVTRMIVTTIIAMAILPTTILTNIMTIMIITIIVIVMTFRPEYIAEDRVLDGRYSCFKSTFRKK